MLRELMQDVTYALRSLRRTPLFTTVAIVTLSVGLAATTTMFSVANGVLIRPLDYRQPDRLVHLQRDGETGRFAAVSYPGAADIRRTSSQLADVAAWQGWSVTLADADGTLSRRPAASVDGNFFSLLGIEPAIGRFFEPRDNDLGHAPVVVIGHGLWQGQFGGDRAVLGDILVVDQVPYTIVGVAPAGFEDPLGTLIFGAVPEAWRARPDRFDESTAGRDWLGFWAIARLADGATLETAQAEVDAIARSLGQSYPEHEGRTYRLVTFKEALVGQVRPVVLIMMAAVAAVLLIACANVANLSLSRGTARRQELAVRSALGAGRRRLLGQLLTESLVLSAVSAAIGVAIAVLGSRAVAVLAARTLPRVDDIGVDPAVLAFALLASFVTAMAFGLAPALQLCGDHVAATLREGGRGGTASVRGAALRNSFVVAEVALAVVLLIGAGLLIKSLWRLTGIDPGFDTEAVLTAQVLFPGDKYPQPEDLTLLGDRLLDEIRSLPGVESAALINTLPMSGVIDSTPVWRVDLPPPSPDERRMVPVRTVTPDYFRVAGMRLLRGRDFDADDRPGATEAGVVNETLARYLFGDEDPIGGSVTVRGLTREVVGVVSDVRLFGLAEPLEPILYTPYAQEPQDWMRRVVNLAVRSPGDGAAIAGAVRAAVRRVDADIPINNVRTMADMVSRDTAVPRF